MDWVNEAKRFFTLDKPKHFSNYRHCDECAEHDETLLSSTIGSIGLEQLGNPGWDPLCFCTAEGIKYYMPALVRLSLSTVEDAFYLGPFLFHLERNGKDNDLFQCCTAKQRRFILAFIGYMILNQTAELELNGCENEALRVHELWLTP